MANIVVSGYMIRLPTAGNMLAYLGHVSGFERLGHRVRYIEESGWDDACYHVSTGTFDNNPGEGISIVRDLFEACGVESSAWFVDCSTGAIDGATRSEHDRAVADADILINLGGTSWLSEFAQIPVRAYVDMDPAFTQAGRFGLGTLAEHTVHFSYGANIGRDTCTVPEDGINWVPTYPPVVTDFWEGEFGRGENLTTVANWTAYGGTTYGERRLGQKDEEFLRLGSLPSMSALPLEICVSGIDAASRTELQRRGWRIRDGSSVVARADYQAYITQSRGEFSVAKHAYVSTRSGWFSDRSVSYLAAGRPVILQDTGYSDWLPVGAGVFPFSNASEARLAIEELHGDYPRHQTAARRLAREVFSYDVVLPRLLDGLR